MFRLQIHRGAGNNKHEVLIQFLCLTNSIENLNESLLLSISIYFWEILPVGAI
jgi:hypothetical protein